MNLKKKCPCGKDESEYRVPRTQPDPVWMHEKNVPFAAFPTDVKWYEVCGRRCNTLAWSTTVHERDKITALVMERERKAYEAIIDNQNTLEPREGEEIKSNGEGKEENSWNRMV